MAPRSVGRRAEILEAFVRHVAARGYERTNMGDIASELAMSKGTIVHHFGTKAQMLRELAENHWARQIDTVRLIWERLATPQERIAGAMYAAVLMQEYDPDATVAGRREAVQLFDDPEMVKARELRLQLLGLISSEIRAGIRAHVFRNVDAELATLQLWGSVQWMWVWYGPDCTQTLAEVGTAFVDIFLAGLLLDRLGMKKLADPRGRVVKVARECLAEVVGAGRR